MLHSLYRIADLTVVPSIYEPFGLVALEAMACGCPCLVADTGGLREVVPHDEVGLRFRCGTRHPCASGRAYSHRRELRSSIVAEAHEHVREFDWADVAERTLDVLRDTRFETRSGVMKTPVLYHHEISHYNEKARWALDYKNVPHVRKARRRCCTLCARAHADGKADASSSSAEREGNRRLDSHHRGARARVSGAAALPKDGGDRRRALELEDFFDEELGPYSGAGSSTRRWKGWRRRTYAWRAPWETHPAP